MDSFTNYNRELLGEMRDESSAANLPLGDVCFERLCSILEAEGEIETAERCRWVGTSGGKVLRIDGHGGDPREADGVLSVIACELHESDEPVTLNASDAKKLFGHLMNLVTASRKRDFRDTLGLQTPVFGTATMIAEAWSTVRKIKLILVTNGIYSARTDAKLAGTIGEIPVTYNIWDLSRLYRVETTGSKEKIMVNFEHDFGGALPALAASAHDTEFPAFLAIIRGRQLAQIYERWGARLLESNIRSFLKATRKSVNEGIRDTIRADPRMFFSYNNGLSATADSIDAKADGAGLRILSARNLQIVNGGQTTASLHAALRHSPETLDQVHVQLKVTVVPSDRSEEVVPNISKFANSQNKVSAADFFSNHPFHLRVEGYSRRVLAPAAPGGSRQTKWFYERARGQYLVERMKLGNAERRRFDTEHPKAQLFLKTDLAKVEFSFRRKPDVVSKGAQKNFAAFASEIGTAWATSENRYDETWFKRLIAKLIIFRALEKAVPRQEWYPGGYRANIVAYGISKLVYDVDKMNKVLDLDRVWRDQSVPSSMLRALLNACQLAAEVLTTPQSGIRNVTEWAKKQACWSGVMRADAAYDEEFTDSLVEPDEDLATQRDGRRQEALLSGIEAQTKVVEMGGAFWSRVRQWAAPNRAFSVMDDGILRACSQLERRLPSERQCVRAVTILDRARREGYVDDEETPRIRISGSRAH